VTPTRDKTEADLHIHTTFSDGTYSPEQVVAIAVEKGLGAIAITDHDNVGGIESAQIAARGKDIEVVAGTELSSYIGDRGMHVVGLFIDPEDARLLEHLEFFRNHRHRRGEEIVNKLKGLGVGISMDEVLAISGTGSVGRPHVAEALVKVGAVRDFQEAFDKYIGNGKPGYVPKYKIDPAESAGIIHAGGGVAILAHPGISTRSDSEIRSVVDMGLDGIETVHAKHASEQAERFTSLAKTEGWLISGGSDCHGENSNYSEIGGCTINVQCLEDIRNFIASKSIIKK